MGVIRSLPIFIPIAVSGPYKRNFNGRHPEELDWSGCGAIGVAPAVELFRPALEGADHAAHRLAEQRADKRLKHARAEFEIDIEIDDARTVGLRLEFRMVFEIPTGHRTVGDADDAGPAQRHA